MSYCYDYPRAAVTVDALIFRDVKQGTEVLLIRRGNEPFKDMWALPGGFIEMDETLEEAIQRELQEETGLSGIELKQLHTFSSVNRDPRHRTISTVFRGIMTEEDDKVIAGDDASEVGWFRTNDLPSLAFDHAEVILMGLKNLKSE